MLVMPLLYRSITINIARKGLSECIENVYETLVERLLAGPSVCALVKEICVVHKSDICSYRRSDNSELLLRLIPRLPRLESLRWEAKGDFPIELLKSLLQYGPKSNFRLCLDIGPVKGNQSLSTYNSLLDQVCHTLLSLRICIPCGFEYPEEPRRVKSKLFSALKGFSKLRSLSIYGEYEYSSVYSYVSDGPRLAVKPAETLPQLRELSVTDGSDTFQWEDLEVWGANGRWSHLQKVTFRDPQLLNGIHGCEKTLISLSLIEVSEGFEKPLADICSRLDRLRELGVGGKNFHVPVAALQKCGHSLKSLVMRNQDMYGRESAKEGSLQALQSIHDSCPMLSSIAMSINRQPVEWVRF